MESVSREVQLTLPSLTSFSFTKDPFLAFALIKW
jgi:hypothetical protein